MGKCPEVAEKTFKVGATFYDKKRYQESFCLFELVEVDSMVDTSLNKSCKVEYGSNGKMGTKLLHKGIVLYKYPNFIVVGYFGESVGCVRDVIWREAIMTHDIYRVRHVG